MRIALVHDYLVQYGGAERVLEEFASLFPDAPIYTLVYDAKATGYAFERHDVRLSFLQKLPRPATIYRFLPLLMPLAIESFNLSKYDLILSSSASFAKGAIGGEGLHVCYCHSPMRYAWLDHRAIMGSSFYPAVIEKAIPFFMPYIRLWDLQSARRPDYFICNSRFVKKKIKKHYDQDATVIYPPLNFHKFFIAKPKDYFLLIGRMVPYKRFDIAIHAFNTLGLPLKVIGMGPEYKRLYAMAGPTIEFLGNISEKDLPQYYAEAQALIFPQEEDFGITALESMAAGRPVIAFRGGGALESVGTSGDNGIFFDAQTTEALCDAVRSFQKMQFEPERIRKYAAQFDRREFRKNIVHFLEEKLREHYKMVRT